MSQTPAPQNQNPFSTHNLISTKNGNVIHRVLKTYLDGGMLIKVSSAPNSEAFVVRAHEVGEWIRRG